MATASRSENPEPTAVSSASNTPGRGWTSTNPPATSTSPTPGTSGSRIRRIRQLHPAWGFGVKDGADVFQVCTAPEPATPASPGPLRGSSGPDGSRGRQLRGPNAGDVYVVDGRLAEPRPGGERQDPQVQQRAVSISAPSPEKAPRADTSTGFRGAAVFRRRSGLRLGPRRHRIRIHQPAGPEILESGEATLMSRLRVDRTHLRIRTGYSWEFDVAADGSHVYLMGMAEECEWDLPIQRQWPDLRSPSCEYRHASEAAPTSPSIRQTNTSSSTEKTVSRSTSTMGPASERWSRLWLGPAERSSRDRR